LKGDVGPAVLEGENFFQGSQGNARWKRQKTSGKGSWAPAPPKGKTNLKKSSLRGP